jgi:hypothetical protein
MPKMPKMTHPDTKRPECFGQLEIVFPMGANGLRHSPETCVACVHKTDCLRTGLRGDAGLKVHEEHVDRSYESGMIGFAERWSKKKAIERRKNGPGSSIVRNLLSRCRQNIFATKTPKHKNKI